jgi:LCP family protein required for cell wall assembly
MMVRRALPATLLLLGLLTLAACDPTQNIPANVKPTIYVAPATPTVYIPPPPPHTPTHSQPTTVLLLGTDRRSAHSTTNNTDTILVFHLDPNTQRVAMLSIPRDLYIDIPNHGQGRINTAYSSGVQDGTGGLELARQTVSSVIGMPVDHAVLIDFDVFITLVDAVGGVDVDVPYDIYDPTYPDSGIGYDPFYLAAGQHHLDGATALKYARTRATAGGDFDRTARQRQVVLAVRDRVLTFDMLPDLIAQSPQLWTSLQNAFETDLTLAEMVDLSVAASRIPTDQLATGAIDQTCTQPWITPTGAQVLVPLPDQIDTLVNELFSAPPASASTQ